MELALYCPVHGYYETEKDNPGRHGDFYTSVGVGELFGQFLAFQFAEWLEADVHSPEPTVQIVEAGAHDGRLARDILAWLQLKRPKLFEQVEYWVIEPSPRRQKWQRETLKDFAPRVRWTAGFQSLLRRERVTRHLPPVTRRCTALFSPTSCSTPCRSIVSAGMLKAKNGSNGVSPLTAKNLCGRGFLHPSHQPSGSRRRPAGQSGAENRNSRARRRRSQELCPRSGVQSSKFRPGEISPRLAGRGVLIHLPFSICHPRCWQCFPTATPSKPVPPPKAGGAKPRGSGTGEIADH